MSASPLVYVYCLLRSARAPRLDAAPAGLDGATPPRALAVGEHLWLVVADAPAERYDEEAIERALGDLDLVGRCALAHEAVVEHVLDAGDVLPMKLFTLFRSEERARADVEARRAEIERGLAAVHGRVEWGVRVRRSGAPPPAPREDAAAATGTAFLQRKHEALQATRRGRAEAEEHASTVFEELSALADDAQRRAPADAGARLVLDAVFLVARPRCAAFRTATERRAEALSAGGLELALTGPWPAYHFVGGAG